EKHYLVEMSTQPRMPGCACYQEKTPLPVRERGGRRYVVWLCQMTEQRHAQGSEYRSNLAQDSPCLRLHPTASAGGNSAARRSPHRSFMPCSGSGLCLCATRKRTLPLSVAFPAPS